MNPTLYDILGVRPDASADEIKRAWRDAAERFEPGSGSSGAQFRLFNEAAEVLLDPQRRREYDDRLAGEDRQAPANGAPVVAPPGPPGPAEPPAAEPGAGARAAGPGGRPGAGAPPGA
ncbi:MAG: J domain-containing protein, partial [Nocardioidaceae bacterium]